MLLLLLLFEVVSLVVSIVFIRSSIACCIVFVFVASTIVFIRLLFLFEVVSLVASTIVFIRLLFLFELVCPAAAGAPGSFLVDGPELAAAVDEPAEPWSPPRPGPAVRLGVGERGRRGLSPRPGVRS